MKITACAEHRLERRGYRNGAGICADCGLFVSRAFPPIDPTAEERARVEELIGPTEDASGLELYRRAGALTGEARAEIDALSYAVSDIAAAIDLARLKAADSPS